MVLAAALTGATVACGRDAAQRSRGDGKAGRAAIRSVVEVPEEAQRNAGLQTVTVAEPRDPRDD